MSILEGIEEIQKQGKKKIPSFNLPRIMEFDVGGKKCTIKRACAEISIPAIAKFGKLLGETMGHIASFSDDNPESATLQGMMGLGFEPSQIKTFLFTHALPQMFAQVPKCGTEIFELWRDLVPDHLTVDGVSIDNYKELEEVGFAGMMMADVLFKAFEVNFYPTLGDQSTDTGDAPQEESEPAKEPVHLVTKSPKKRRAGIVKAGRSGRMSKRSG